MVPSCAVLVESCSTAGYVAYDVAILDAFGDIATVRVLSSAYMDYLHVARSGAEWLLLNVLWQRRPGGR